MSYSTVSYILPSCHFGLGGGKRPGKKKPIILPLMPTSGRSKNYSNMELLWWNFSSEKNIHTHDVTRQLYSYPLSVQTGMADEISRLQAWPQFPQMFVKLACSRFKKQSRVSAEGSWQLLNLITSVTCSRKRAARQKLFVHAKHSNPTSPPHSKHRQTPAASPLFWHHSLSISKMTKFTDKAGDRSAQQEAGRAQLSPSVHRLPWPSPHSRMAAAAAAARRGGGGSQTPAAPGLRSSARTPPADQKGQTPGRVSRPCICPFPVPWEPGPRSNPNHWKGYSPCSTWPHEFAGLGGGWGSNTRDRDRTGGGLLGRGETGAAPGFCGFEPTSCFGSRSSGGWSPVSHRGGSGLTPKWLQWVVLVRTGSVAWGRWRSESRGRQGPSPSAASRALRITLPSTWSGIPPAF